MQDKFYMPLANDSDAQNLTNAIDYYFYFLTHKHCANGNHTPGSSGIKIRNKDILRDVLIEYQNTYEKIIHYHEDLTDDMFQGLTIIRNFAQDDCYTISLWFEHPNGIIHEVSTIDMPNQTGSEIKQILLRLNNTNMLEFPNKSNYKCTSDYGDL